MLKLVIRELVFIMLIKCNHCHSKAIIIGRDTVTIDYAKLRCQCTNIDCGHRFLMELSFIKTTTPALNQINRSILDSAMSLLKTLPVEQRQAIIQELQGA